MRFSIFLKISSSLCIKTIRDSGKEFAIEPPGNLPVICTLHLLANCSISLTPTAFDRVNLRRYWSPQKVGDLSASVSFSPSRYLDELEEVLTTAVAQESNADVPLGSFLSGGIDSSLITALLQKHSGRKIETFSLGFNEKRYDFQTT